MKKMKINNTKNFTHIGVSTFASRTSPSTDQRLQKSLHLSHADKIELKKISSPSENKKYATAQPNDRQKSVAMQTPEPLTGMRFNYSVDRRPACNTGLAKVAVKCSADTFVVNQNWFSASTFVVKIAIIVKPETFSKNITQIKQ
ncbi:hypothetical protein [Sediminibacterium sp.]|uniref:hypothetical protein n=1 Tax=Sediminibacterium sp. TaxID=1917865 RepID=UPI00273756C1|nr:hypothetical protein [Sediminibacterium sp.]MDP3567667.1 hypothetical protein [Sediminibacterium sp.]